MLSVFLFTVVISLNDYHIFTVKPDRPFSMTLDRSILVLAISKPSEDLQLTIVNHLNQTQIIPMTYWSHLMFTETSIAISLKNPAAMAIQIHCWLLPNHFCDAVSYSVIVDHRISFQLLSDSAASNFCLFAHSGKANRYSTFLDFHSTVAQAGVEFYTNSIVPDYTCQLNSICTFASERPFITRFANVTKANLAAAITLSADRESIDPYECGVKRIPFIVEPPVHTPMSEVSISDTKCVSMAENTLKNIGIGVTVVVAVLVLLTWMHLWGVIDLKAMMLGSRETVRFLLLKENPYAQPLFETVAENTKS
jgi:hypothetical protein